MPDKKITVLQVIDSLSFGGAEQMAVNIANSLPRERYRMHLCSTRREGPLAKQLLPDVGRLVLNRKSRFHEPRAVCKLIRYIRIHKVRILHSHQTTVFICSLACLFCPSVAMVWHDHFGPVSRSRWLYKLGTLRVEAVIAVNEELARWAHKELGFAKNRVFFVNNFVAPRLSKGNPHLPLKRGYRIVCTANISPTKDLINLIKAIRLVANVEPTVHAYIIGDAKNEESRKYLDTLKRAIDDQRVQDRIFFLGPRDDVEQILNQCDIGVLSSVAEGLPLSLIEYGMAGLPTVATRVGQCSEVLGDGQYGTLVPPSDPDALATAIIKLLRSKSDSKSMGQRFRRATLERYGSERNTKEIMDIYDKVLRSDEMRIVPTD